MAVADIDPTTFRPKGQRVSQSEKAALAAQGLRWCPKCRVVKPLEAFGACRSKPDGLFGRCKACANAKTRARYKVHYRDDPERREANRKRCREWYLERSRNDPEWREAERKRGREKDRKRTAQIMRTKARLERAIAYFAERPAYLKHLALYADKRPDARHLQFASDAIEGLVAFHVYGEE